MNYIFKNLKEETTWETFYKAYEKAFGLDFNEYKDKEDILQGKITQKWNEWVHYDDEYHCIVMFVDDAVVKNDVIIDEQ